MATTVGYVGTLQAETRGTNRIWVGLTRSAHDDDWVNIGAHRAWFTMNLEAADRPVFMAQLSLLTEAMRSGLQVEIAHDGAASFHKRTAGDSYECTGVRILRAPLRFS